MWLAARGGVPLAGHGVKLMLQRRGVRANVVGLVLNEVHKEISDTYYYYGYYGKYYKHYNASRGAGL